VRGCEKVDAKHDAIRRNASCSRFFEAPNSGRASEAVLLNSVKRYGRGPPLLCEQLLRPFIDLEPCARGPLYAQGVEQYWNAFAGSDRPRFALQRTLPRAFRQLFLDEARLRDYQVEDPRELPSALRSDRWSSVCDALKVWPDLTVDQQCRLVLLLHALCFYSLISSCVPVSQESNIELNPDRAELAYWGASARYVLGLEDRVADYGNADMSEFGRIALTFPQDDPVALNAAIKLLAHGAKTNAPVEELEVWRSRAERILEMVVAKAEVFTSNLLTSRFYRAAAFVPQYYRDQAEVVRTMDLAERHALAMVPSDDAQNLLFLENLHPVLESRTKEAIWIGDLDLALSRALLVVDLDPYDSRTWLELGQVRLKRNEPSLAAEAYAMAAIIGPPASAIARHMVGRCIRDLGQTTLSAFLFQSALAVDQRAISPHEQIESLPDLPVFEALKEWSLRSFDF